jgi:hypothetical protein
MKVVIFYPGLHIKDFLPFKDQTNKLSVVYFQYFCCSLKHGNKILIEMQAAKLQTTIFTKQKILTSTALQWCKFLSQAYAVFLLL